MKLTKSQRKILIRLPFFTNTEIAKELNISRKNLRGKLQKIYKALDVADVGEDKPLLAVVKALKRGDITMGDFAKITDWR